MNVISQPDNLPPSYSHKPSFCFNISSPFSPAVRTIRYYRSIGFHPNQKEETRYVWPTPRGSPPVAWQWPVRWLPHYKVTRTPSCFCLYWVMTFWRGTPGGTNKRVLPIHSSNVVYPCGLQRVCVCVCVRLPFYALQAPKLLTASSWIWCKNVCSKVRQCRWVCVLYFTCFISERAAPDDNAKSTSLFPCACVRWKVCHASNIVSDIWRCLLTVGALSSSHFNICLLTQTTKKVTHVTSDHIVTQKLFFLYSTNLKMSSQVHLNHDLQNLVLLGNKKPNY